MDRYCSTNGRRRSTGAGHDARRIADERPGQSWYFPFSERAPRGEDEFEEERDGDGWDRDRRESHPRLQIAQADVRWPLLDVTSGAYTEEMEQEVIAVKPHVDGYGLTVVRMDNFIVSIKDEDEATLKRLTKDAAP
jgi:hypothetical protein